MSLVLQSSGGGQITVQEPATASNFTQTLPAASGEVVVTGANSAIVSGTAVASTSGTSIDFTSIPSWVKRITVMFAGVSTNGTSGILVRIGDSGGISATGYQGAVTAIVSSVASGATPNATAYFIGGGLSSNALIGNVVLTNPTGNSWVGSWVMYVNDTQVNQGAGARTLSNTLDRVRITTVNGTDTFDAGSINILYE
jgi:hypothetical protein